MPDTPAIHVQDLTYRYGPLTAVDHISFAVGQGEILGFLGPNGAGKTTTLGMLTGQLRPQEGHALLLGMDITQHTAQIQSQIGVCFETTNLYEGMTAEENLRFFSRLFGVKNLDVAALIQRVGLDGRSRDRVESYSKGMKQRLMIARALVNQPRILFLDEPTEGLDPVSAEAIRRLILEEKQRGATIFLTTHDMLEADRLSDRVAFISQGRIVALDTPHNLKQQYGKRVVKAQVAGPEGRMEAREITLDTPETAGALQDLFNQEQVITIHSEEASLEDIFIQLTGQRLTK
ncbi:MAG: ABC transporter ATP-binding protein [Brevefilum sp.]|nr:ABC transporter ATP-binding protein [Brevefilum sp.]